MEDKKMSSKKRAVRHKAKEWTRMTLRVDPNNKEFLNTLCDDLGISQNLLINKIIDCFRDIDNKSKKTIGTHMIISSLRKDSDKYDVTKSTISLQIKNLKEGMI